MRSLLEELSHHCHFQIHIISFFVSFDNIMDKGSMKKHAMENDLPDQKPKTKKAKLAELLQFSSNLPKHSQNALAAILEKAKKSGIPDLQIYTVATNKGKPGSNFLIVAMEELWVH